MAGARATVYGAVSIVNAIAAGRGATLGISLKTDVTVETASGTGISVHPSKSASARLVLGTIRRIVPRRTLEGSRVRVTVDSEIPAGYGLKSSSSLSSAVALACARIFKPDMDDRPIILAGVNASIESKVSITGAYDDACACYYGGFNVTDNIGRKRVSHASAPSNLIAVIYLPRKRKRGNVRSLRGLLPAFAVAWDLARDGRYWDAMMINGLATAPLLSAEPDVVTDLMASGALGASVSGNGPAVAAVTKRGNEDEIRSILAERDGTIITSRINNRKATVHEV